MLSGRKPSSAKAIEDLEFVWGGHIFFAGDLRDGTSIVEIPGVVLHIDPSDKSMAVQGDMNLLLGRGRMLQKLNKVSESYWVRGIDPTAMAPAEKASDLYSSQNAEAVAKARRLASSTVEAYLETRTPAQLKAVTLAVESFLEAVIAAAKSDFEPGAFFKGKNDYATRESDGIFMSSSMDPTAMAKAYAADLKGLAAGYGRKAIPNDDVDEWMDDAYTAAATMTHHLLAHPEDVLVQQKLDLAKTDAGNLMEFRVDVFDGHVVNASFRYGLEFHPDEAAGAGKMVQKFFDKAPKGDRYFTGGLDVAMLKDGTFKIIETNPGTQSSFIDSGTYPISGNLAVSKFLGHPTPLLMRLMVEYAGGPKTQAEFLSTLRSTESEAVTSLDQLTKFEFLVWVRDKYLGEWVADPSDTHRRTLLRRIRQVARDGGVPDDDEFEEYIIDRMKEFMDRKS